MMANINPAPAASTAMTLTMAMRGLWQDHISYTRQYIMSALANLPDTSAISARLMKNQDDIGSALGTYYGKKSGQRLGSLLRTHIQIATTVVAAIKANDPKALASAQARWADNGDQLAAWFSSANPNWPKKTFSDMLTDHLKLTSTQVSARVAGDWVGDIETCDKLKTHMMEFADFLSDGIVKQFPNRFSGCP